MPSQTACERLRCRRRTRQAAALLHEAAQRIEAARRLLEGEESLSGQGVADVAAPSHQPNPAIIVGDAFTHLLNARLGLQGRASARLLARMIAEPDRLIPLDELAQALGPRAASTRALKVHICHLRTALLEKGFSAAAIQTGRASYGFRGALIPALFAIIEDDDAGCGRAAHESKRDR